VGTANQELARLFDRIADALELKGESGFHVLAYRRAARTLDDLADDVGDLDLDGRLRDLTGIGEGIAKKIHEFLATGRMKKYDSALADMPPGLFALLDLQGLGPKTVRLLSEQLGISDLASLKAALDSEAVAGLPGMGLKKVDNIRRSIRLSEMAGERMYLNEAGELAQSVIGHVRSAPGAGRVTAAGSLRRGKETVGDLDVLATGSDAGALVERFKSHPAIEQLVAAGPTKASALFRTPSGLRQVDLRVVRPNEFGAALQYFTGSKDHNVRLRGIAREQGLKISEYGVFRGKKRIAGATEEEVYAAVGLSFIEPELREDRGEIEAARGGELPKLVTLKDIRSDLHMHTSRSDGHDTREAMVEACRRRGYTHMAIAEHSVSASYAGGLTPDQLRRHCDWVDKSNAKSSRFRILKAVECDIRTDGKLDYSDALLARLDLVVASIHQGFRKSVTERICAALAHPLVHIVAHPSGRIIGKRPGYEVDLERVIACAAEHGRILEVNSFYGRLDLSDAWARKAKEAGVKLAVNTDAHAVADLDWMQYGVTTARRAWLTKADVVNTLTCGQLLKLLGSMRRR
jgi:DNA polymerase (family 10)